MMTFANCRLLSAINQAFVLYHIYFTGDIVTVVYDDGTDTTPVDLGFYTGFSGFRIALNESRRTEVSIFNFSKKLN